MENTEKKEISEEIIAGLFADMREALKNLDIDQMESVIEAMDQYCYDVRQEEFFENLKDCVEDEDVDTCEEILGPVGKCNFFLTFHFYCAIIKSIRSAKAYRFFCTPFSLRKRMAVITKT